MRLSVLNEPARGGASVTSAVEADPLRHPPTERICRYAEGLASWLHEFGSTRTTKREVLPKAVLTRALAWTDLVS